MLRHETNRRKSFFLTLRKKIGENHWLDFETASKLAKAIDEFWGIKEIWENHWFNFGAESKLAKILDWMSVYEGIGESLDLILWYKPNCRKSLVDWWDGSQID